MDIGAKLKALRLRNDLTLEEVASRADQGIYIAGGKKSYQSQHFDVGVFVGGTWNQSRGFL